MGGDTRCTMARVFGENVCHYRKADLRVLDAKVG
jgi:hypothetical protein